MKLQVPQPGRLLFASLLLITSLLFCSCAEMMVAGIASASSEKSIDVYATTKELRGRNPKPVLSPADIADTLQMVKTATQEHGLQPVSDLVKDEVLAAYALHDSGDRRMLVRCIIHDLRQPEHLEIAVGALILSNSDKRAQARYLRTVMASNLVSRFGPDRIHVQ